jgi:hypothetical protein
MNVNDLIFHFLKMTLRDRFSAAGFSLFINDN